MPLASSLGVVGGACSVLLGLSYVLLGLAHLLLPPDQNATGSARYFMSLAQDPGPLLRQFGAALAGGLLAFGAIPAIARIASAKNEGWVRWTTNLAYLGYALVAVDSIRFLIYQPGRARTFAAGSEAVKAAIQQTEVLIYLDAGGLIGFGGPAAWLLAVNVLAWRYRLIPRPLAAVGLLAAVMLADVAAAFMLNNPLLFLIGAVGGGFLAAPAWFVWIGVLLLRGRLLPATSAPAGGVDAAVPPPGSAGPEITPAHALQRSAFFGALPAQARDALVAALRVSEVAPEHVIVREGDPGDLYYLIGAGHAEVWAARGKAARSDAVKGELWTPGPQRYSHVATLGAGEGFGEMALLLGGERRATVRASGAGPVTLYELDGATFTRVVDEHRGLAVALEEEMALRSVSVFLGKASPFARLPVEALRGVATHLHPTTIAAGTDVFRRGDPGDAFYIVRTGEVEVLVAQPDGTEHRVVTLGPGDPFGEQALLTGERRSATVRGIGDVEALRLTREDFEGVLQQHRDRGQYFAQLTLQRQRPQRIEHWAMEQVERPGGERAFVLKDTVRHRYMKLSEKGAFLWDLMDGQHTVRDLTMAYFARYQTFGLDAVIDAMLQLQAAGFVRAQRIDASRLGALASLNLLQRTGLRLMPLISRHFALPDADAFVSRAYHLLSPLFWRPVQLALMVLTVAGATAYVATLLGGRVPLPPANDTRGAAVSVALLAFFGFVVQGLCHELAHALTTKHFGREVHRVGVGWYLFMPVAFVDTSDMWLAGKWARAATAIAGPYTNLVVAGLATLGASLVPDETARFALFQVATTGYVLALLNLNPLIELDGYYILMDVLDVPNLRAKALAYVGGVASLSGSTTPDPRLRRIFGGYGILTLVYTLFVVGAVVVSYTVYVQRFVGQLIPPLPAALLGWALAGLMASLIVARAVRELRAGMLQARRAHPRNAQAQHAAA